MQGLFWIILPNGQRLAVLARETKTARYVHLAKSPGKADLRTLNDESEFLKDRPDLVEKLLKGETVIF